MIKPIAIVAHDPELIKIHQELNDIVTHFNQRREFLQKQMDDLRQQADKVASPVMDRVVAYLVQSKKMPGEYDPKKHHLHFDDGAILLCDGGHDFVGRITVV